MLLALSPIEYMSVWTWTASSLSVKPETFESLCPFGPLLWSTEIELSRGEIGKLP